MFKQVAFITVVSLAIVCCGGKNNSKPQNTIDLLQQQPKQEVKDEGKTIYMKYCFACHQMDGSGVPGMYPPIKKTDWVAGDKDRLIKLVLEGIKDPIEVNGEEYNQAMPKHDFLTNKQIANVLTYIRKNFGNNATAVTEQEVTRHRKK